MNIYAADEPYQTSVIAISGITQIPWLKLLKPGFRHCFAIIQQGEHWIICEGLSDRVQINQITTEQLPAYLASLCSNGIRLHVVRTRRSGIGGSWMFRPFTCVELVKRLCDVRDRLMFTPHQLHRFLLEQNKNKKLRLSCNRLRSVRVNNTQPS